MMKKMILILVPIAASNIFGFARYLLIQTGMIGDIDRHWRAAPFLLAIFLTVLLAKTRNLILGYFCMAILVIGAVSSLGGIWLGLKVGSNVAAILGFCWLVVFVLGAYKLPSTYMTPKADGVA